MNMIYEGLTSLLKTINKQASNSQLVSLKELEENTALLELQ